MNDQTYNPPVTHDPFMAAKHEWLSEAIDFGLHKIHCNMRELTAFPERTDGNSWICVEDGSWVGGHWVGLLWLAYAHTQNSEFERAARIWASKLAARQNDDSTHDLGFLFELSHVLGFRFTGDCVLRKPALIAALTLYKRFNPNGNFFQAWGDPNSSLDLRGRTIIDTMMNLDLLFWASQQTNNPDFSIRARAHARTCQKYSVRSNGSTAHVVDFDPLDGSFIKQDTHQGLSPTSCWSRGQSWAVYGFSDCYRHTGQLCFLQIARNLASFALDRLPADLVPYWDYDSPLIPQDVRDSSAAAILAAGLLNLAAIEIDPQLAQSWRSHAFEILSSLWFNYTSRNHSVPSILLHGTRSKPHGLADHGLIYGDYYFFEAMIGLNNPKIWDNLS